MIKPNNTTINKINAKTSMFNKLGVDYNSHSLEHQLYFYETAILLETELPKEDKENALLGAKYRSLRKETGLIKNECYYDGRVKFGSKPKTMTDVFLFLYDIDKDTKV